MNLRRYSVSETGALTERFKLCSLFSCFRCSCGATQCMSVFRAMESCHGMLSWGFNTPHRAPITSHMYAGLHITARPKQLNFVSPSGNKCNAVIHFSIFHQTTIHEDFHQVNQPITWSEPRRVIYNIKDDAQKNNKPPAGKMFHQVPELDKDTWSESNRNWFNLVTVKSTIPINTDGGNERNSQNCHHFVENRKHEHLFKLLA